VLPEDGTLVLKHVRDMTAILIYNLYFAFGWCNKLGTLLKKCTEWTTLQ